MGFFEDVDRAAQLLTRHGRVSRSGLRREFGGDDELVGEIIDELVVRGVAEADGAVVSAVEQKPSPASTPPTGEPDLVESDAGEIRQLTVLFCDTVNSTALSGQLGSEEWSDTMRDVLEMATASIRSFGGHVGNYMGDGLIAFFGYPVAQEDAAERAVRAGLAMQAELASWNESGRFAVDEGISIRVGVHTGPVVIDLVAGTVQVTGRTANLAARVESAAPVGSVAMSPETFRLVSGVFVTESLGAHELKGFAEPVELIEATAVGGLAPRLGAGRSGDTAFIGRGRDTDALQTLWSETQSGHGAVAEIVGEAGIGKSRLLDCFRSSLTSDNFSWLDCVCSPLSRSAPLFPIAELQARGLGFQLDSPAEEKITAITTHMENIGLDPGRALDLLDGLHGLGLSDDTTRVHAEVQRVELFEFMIDWIAVLARRQPLVLSIEDLHWADPTTLDFIDRLAERAVDEPMFVLVTSRPHRARELDVTTPVHRTRLERLTEAESRQMVKSIAGSSVSPVLLDSIVQRGDGVPLFIEELATAALRDPDAYEVPVSVNNLLMARLESLGDVGSVAQAAAMIGREFTISDLRLVLDQPEAEWRPLLDIAVSRGVFFARTTGPETEWVFKHALMRDAVYESMRSRTRRELHLAFARGVAASRPALADRRPDLVAGHFTDAGRPSDASLWWQRAAELALRTASASEAERFYRKALESTDADEVSRRVELEVALAGTLSSLYGFGHEEVEQIWHRVIELTESVDTEAHGLEWHRGVAYTVLGVTVAQRDFVEGRRWAAVADEIASEHGFGDILLCLASLETMLRFYEGFPLDCVARAEALFASGASSTDKIDRAVGLALEPMLYGWYGAALALLGRYSSSIAANARAQEIASVVAPATQTLLITIGASGPLMRDDVQQFTDLSDEYVVEARRYELGYSILIGDLTSVASHLILDPDDEQLALLEELEGQLAGGGRVLAVPIFAWILAMARLSCGRVDEAEETAEFAQLMADATNQHWLDGHLCAFRLGIAERRGELSPGWFEESQEVYDLVRERSLNTGALFLAAKRRELAGDGPHAEEAERQLGEALAAIPEPIDAPLLVRARELLG